MFGLPHLDSSLWNLPSFIYFAIGILTCLLCRRNNPRLAFWGLTLLLLATAVRAFELFWFNSWLRAAEGSGLWTEDSLQSLDLLVDFLRLMPSIIGSTFAVILFMKPWSKPTEITTKVENAL
jgi:hypothetical protein